MVPAPTASLVDALRRFRLLEPAQSDEIARTLASGFPEPKALAGELIQRGWLTPYQANQLLQGRGEELLLGSYVLLEKLGEGGMGAVFKARNWKLGRVVALKLIRKERLDNLDAVRRFHREVRAVAALSHPNIVHAHDADEIGGTHLLVMEYVEGAIDLSRLVKTNGPLPVAVACEYVRQTALGLQHAHERGMVHRDIKPANLLLTAGGKVVKVLDMGLARLDHAGADDDKSGTMTQKGIVMGTPDYLSPEQAQESHTVDIRADLYSLGCTLYFLLTGHAPFPSGTFIDKILKHRLEDPQPVEALRPDVPPAVAALVRRLMAKRPEDRYQTPAEVAAALAPLPLDGDERTFAEGPPAEAEASGDTVASPFAHLETVSPAADSPQPPRKKEQLGRLLLGVAGGALVFVGLVSALVFVLTKWAGVKKPLAIEEDPPVAKTPAVKTPPPEVDIVWRRRVAALPPEKQVEAVAARLRELNPGFDGKVTRKIEGGVVTELRFVTDKVTDVSPVRALAGLGALTCCGGGGRGALADLSPLKEMKLWLLDCGRTKVRDLSPLTGMKLTSLWIGEAEVADLEPLRGMPLTRLHCFGIKASDLSPLRGMKLKYLNCGGTPVSDLSPLKGMKLTHLNCGGTYVTNLSPLRGMPLEVVHCDIRPYAATGVLRTIESLGAINDKPAAEFWGELDARRAALEAWCKSVALLPAEKQVEAVAAKLKELNPGFDGKVTHKIEGGAVTDLRISAPSAPPVRDLSPVRALTGLRTLFCGSSEEPGMLHDLSPLAGMKLTVLGCFGNQVADLSPLEGMKLTSLLCYNSRVADLSPLKGMPLTYLHTAGTLVSDLSPLEGMKLKTLYIDATKVSDLSPLRTMPLTTLGVGGTPVSDLTPLKGMPLTSLTCRGTKASDLSPLAGMKLTWLYCNRMPVSDLSPLKGMPLRVLCCDFNTFRDVELLRAIGTLETINDKPAKEFWKEVDAKRAAFDAWSKTVAALPPEKQAEAVGGKLKELNPGFDGKVTRKIQGGTVTELRFVTDKVTDISPVRVLVGLRVLECPGSSVGEGKLSDLAPLTGLKLTTLNCASNKVVHLLPLRGLPLNSLICNDTRVADLAPLKDMPLTLLYCAHTRVADLSPLRGMPLTAFVCEDTRVADLSPLKDMKLTALGFQRTSVVDLKPLQGMPLQILHFDFHPYRDTRFLRSLETLGMIDGKPAKDFWKEVDAKQVAFEAWSKTVAALPPEKQAEAVGVKLKELNPGFDGKVTHKVEGGAVTDLQFLTDNVKDISPVRALAGLRVLNCAGSGIGKGKLSDLSPLKGMKLKDLNCERTKVSDLSPLAGMPLARLAYRGTKVSDLSPLKGVPLKDLCGDLALGRDAPILRSLKGLEKINGQPAKEFWLEVERKKP